MNELLQRLREHGSSPALACGDRVFTYEDLLDRCQAWRTEFEKNRLEPGAVVSIEGEYGPETIAALLATMLERLIATPLSTDSRAQHETFRKLAQVGVRACLDGAPTMKQASGLPHHPLYAQLRDSRHPGLVLFTSGSTGESKAAVHDLLALWDRVSARRRKMRTLVFLQLDHIGGINTLFYTLANGGMVVTPTNRSPQAVCRAIQDHQVELLPTSPTFLNLLLISGEAEKYDLSSLTRITYGTEPMPMSTLERLHAAFPEVTLQQTYGLTEVGILRSKSRTSDSLWVQVGGDEYDVKVVDGRLWVRATTAMLGYLNAPSPLDEDGYFDTQDRVEVDGKWMKFLGRESEIINVGGSKVYPAEVESVLLQMTNVIDATVCGQESPITGQIVTATVRLEDEKSPRDFRTRMRLFCKDRLPAFAVPAKVAFSEDRLHNARFKRIRAPHAD